MNSASRLKSHPLGRRGVLRSELRLAAGRLASWVRQRRPASMRIDLPLAAGTVSARLTPLDARGVPGETREVVLHTMDGRGIAFNHLLPLAERRAMVTIESPHCGPIVAEVDLSWCRYRAGGGYTSGGRFVHLYRGG